jgi:hypothetical protein
MQLKNTHEIALGGEITYQVLNLDGTIDQESSCPWHNDVLDNFWTKINDRTGTLNYLFMKVGTDGSPTNLSATALTNGLALSTGNNPNTSMPSGRIYPNEWVSRLGVSKASYSWTFTYAVGQLTGTVREFGIDFAVNSLQSSSPGFNVSNRVVGFPDITINASQQLVVKYDFWVYVKLRKSSQVVPADLYGVPTPITVDIYRKSIGDELFTNPIVGNIPFQTWSIPMSKTYSPGNTEIADTGGQLYTQSIAEASVPAEYRSAARFFVPISRGNYVAGIKAISAITDRFIVHFTPPIVKDADSEFRFSVANKVTKISAGEAAAITAPIDYTQPIVDLGVDPTTLVLRDASGIFTVEDTRRYLSGTVLGLPAFTLPHFGTPIEQTQSIRLRSEMYFELPLVYSIEMIAMFNPLGNVDMAIFGVGNADNDTRLLHNTIVSEISKNTSSQLKHQSNDSVNTSTAIPSGKWVRIVIHKINPTARYTQIYVDGTLAANLNGTFAANAIPIMDQIGRALLFPRRTETPRAGGSILLHSLKFYENYLIPTTNPLPALDPTPIPRTMLLLDFVGGLPTYGPSKAYNFNAGVWNANGGKDDLPYVRMTNEHIQITDLGVQIPIDGEFTMEFDIRIVTTPSNNLDLITCSAKNTSDPRGGLILNTSRGLSFRNTGGSQTGSTTLAANTWETITIVRRVESTNMVTYVFKDGVVGVKLTTSSITTESAYHMLGNFGMFGNLYDTVNAYGAVYDIANMRITKGVIEHFNPAGFVQPTGARGVLN